MKNIIITAAVLFLAACSAKVSKPLDSAVSNSPSAINSTEINFISADINLALSKAKASGKPVYVDVSTSWCGWCKKMKATTYVDQGVIKTLNAKFINLSVDAEKGDGIAFSKKHGVTAFPTQLILSAEGNLLKKNVGFLTSEKLISFVE